MRPADLTKPIFLRTGVDMGRGLRLCHDQIERAGGLGFLDLVDDTPELNVVLTPPVVGLHPGDGLAPAVDIVPGHRDFAKKVGHGTWNGVWRRFQYGKSGFCYKFVRWEVCAGFMRDTSYNKYYVKSYTEWLGN